MNNIFEFLIRSLVGIIWLVALICTTILLAPVHLLIMMTGSIFQKPNIQTQMILSVLAGLTVL